MAEHERILVRRYVAMGDVLMTTPILRALRRDNPDAWIAYETRCPHLLLGNPHVNEICHSANPFDFDRVIDLRYEDAHGENVIDAMAKRAGVTLDSRRMEIHLPADPPPNVGGPYVVFHTGKSWKSKTWPIGCFEEVARGLVDQGLQVVQIGDAKTEVIQRAGCHDYRFRSFGFAVGAMRSAQFFVGIDSAPSNIAKAVNCPAYVIHGCTNPDCYAADSIEHRIWASWLECRGCRNRTSDTMVECMYGHEDFVPACLSEITPQAVLANIRWGEERCRRLAAQ